MCNKQNQEFILESLFMTVCLEEIPVLSAVQTSPKSKRMNEDRSFKLSKLLSRVIPGSQKESGTNRQQRSPIVFDQVT